MRLFSWLSLDSCLHVGHLSHHTGGLSPGSSELSGAGMGNVGPGIGMCGFLCKYMIFFIQRNYNHVFTSRILVFPTFIPVVSI